jgi:hypothetical protein
MGDPAGIGPDIALLSWLERSRRGLPAFVLYGDPQVLQERARLARCADRDVAARKGRHLPMGCLSRPADLRGSGQRCSHRRAIEGRRHRAERRGHWRGDQSDHQTLAQYGPPSYPGHTGSWPSWPHVMAAAAGLVRHDAGGGGLKVVPATIRIR